MANYDCDGFFYDILMYHADGCVNPPMLKSMRKLGLDPHNALVTELNFDTGMQN